MLREIDALQALRPRAAAGRLNEGMSTSSPPIVRRAKKGRYKKSELWTVYELATACPGRYTNTGHMKLNGSTTRKYSIHMLKYIIPMCTKTCHRQALTRAFLRYNTRDSLGICPRCTEKPNYIVLAHDNGVDSIGTIHDEIKAARPFFLRGPANLCCQRCLFLLDPTTASSNNFNFEPPVACNLNQR